MRLLVCGSRDWTNRDYLYGVLDGIHASQEVTVVIEGEARGADVMAADWARGRRITVIPFAADWDGLGRGAGIVRNAAMLSHGKPELVIAFHPDLRTSKGTADMVGRARAAGLEVWIFSGPQAHGAAVSSASVRTSLPMKEEVT